MMLMTAGLATLFALFKILIGSVIGLSVVLLAYRSHLGTGLALRRALVAGMVFVLVSGVAAWADSHTAIQNGKRMDVAPWGEDLRLRNRIVENELVLCIAASS